jgi:signal transduction histidine kinase
MRRPLGREVALCAIVRRLGGIPLRKDTMKAGTTHYLHRAFVECSSHEVLGGIHQQAGSSRPPSKRTSSPNQPFVRICRPTGAIAERSSAACSSPQNKSVFMIISHRLRQRLSKWRPSNAEQRSSFLKDERQAERKRIARELHDTLLQGLQGVLLEVELFSQTSMLTAEQRERTAKIERQLRDIVTDGRDAICALRSPVDERDWMAVILDMGDRLAMESKIGFSLCIKGSPWKLQPKARIEVLAIVRESLRNAFEHSHAQDIRVVLNYAKRGLRISIRDNGIGVSEQYVQLRQKEGHWGIAGMRERTAKLGGRLIITSALLIGTTIKVVIPRHSTFTIYHALFISMKNLRNTKRLTSQRPLIEQSAKEMSIHSAESSSIFSRLTSGIDF